MATANGRRITNLQLQIPPAGGWTLTARLQDGAPLAPGPLVLIVGDLTLHGTTPAGRGGLDSPAQPSVVAYGGAGWRLPLPAPGGAFASPGGVRLSTVLDALAAGAGEAYDAPAEGKLGPAYGWDEGTRGSVVLAELVRRRAVPSWRVAANGRTRFDPWPSLPAADAHGTVEDRDLARGVRHVALSGSVAAWLPGATVQGVRIARVTISERDSETKVSAWDA